MIYHHFSAKIENFLKNTSASAYWKDKKGAYLGVNENFLKVSATHSQDEIIKKTDENLLWAKQASVMIRNDREIATGLTKTYIEPAVLPDNSEVYYLSHKTPLHNRRGKIIGTFGLSFLMNDIDLMKTALNEMHSIYYPIPLTQDSIPLPINQHKNNAGLTRRQLDCLSCLVKGMTMKQIAKTLNLSPKTVEHYLDHIKIKLNCQLRSELITKALTIPAIRAKLI